jgi:hypothetical protein
MISLTAMSLCFYKSKNIAEQSQVTLMVQDVSYLATQ